MDDAPRSKTAWTKEASTLCTGAYYWRSLGHARRQTGCARMLLGKQVLMLRVRGGIDWRHEGGMGGIG